MEAAPQSTSRRAPLTSRRVGIATFVFVLVVVLAHNRFVFTQHRYDDGDFAANSILIDRARHFGLLIGNYSRVGFFHPGPALLYAQAFSQLLFHDALPLTRTAFGAHVLGIVILDASMIGVAASIIHRRTQSLLGPAVLVLGVFVYAGLQPGLVSSTWMPNVYVWPFLLLLVAAASVLSGDRRDVWALLLADGLLVHGHVSFLMFTVVITGLAALAVVVDRRRTGRWDITRRTAIASGAVVGLFALPIVVNLVLHWPGQFQKYLDYTRSNDAVGHGLADALHFARLYWSSDRAGVYFALGLFALAAALVAVAPRHRSFLVALLAQVPLATALVVVYAMRGVDDLEQRYVATFSYVVPVVLATALALAAAAVIGTAPGFGTRPGQVVAAGVVVALLVAATADGLANPYPGAPWLPDASATLDRTVGDGPVGALRFENPAWPPAAGVLEYERRAGRTICLADRSWAFVFTDETICSADELAAATLVTVLPGGSTPTPGPADGGRVVFADPSVVLRVAG